jgi:hypothetical protein
VVVAAGTDAGPPTCDQPDAGPDAGAQSDFTNLPALVGGQAVTLVVTAPTPTQSATDYANAFLLVDETAPSVAGQVGVRFTNATGQPTATYDFGLGGGVVFTKVSSADGATHVDPAADPSGYVTVAPFTQIDTSIQTAGVDYGASGSLDASAGTMLSAFVASGGPNGTAFVVCYDGQTNSEGPWLTQCTPVSSFSMGHPPLPQTRFGNFTADPNALPVKVCAKYASQAAFGAPISSLGSLAVGGVSARVGLHAGFTYNLRLVAAGSATCDTAVAPDTVYSPPSGGATVTGVTVAFAGFATPPDAGVPADGGSDSGADGGADAGSAPNTAFAALPFQDLACGESTQELRIVDLAAAQSSPQTVTLLGTGNWSVPNIPYGGFVTLDPADACGYEEVATITNGSLQTYAGVWNLNITSTTADTLYLYGSRVLDCKDTDSTATACVALGPGG